MKISETMSRDVKLAAPSQTIREAAHMMADIDAGSIPVAENDQLVGMITDRDIAVRAVARGLGPDTRVREVMSPNILYCFEDQDVSDVVNNMGDIQVRRLPVLNRQKRLVGIVSVGDLAKTKATKAVGEALGEISKPGGPHCQSGDGVQ